MYHLRPKADYQVADSPVKQDIEAIIFQHYEQASISESDQRKRAIDDALYLAVIKRMAVREYSDIGSYLTGLLSDVENAKYEFSQVAYDNETTSEVFFSLKMHLMGLLVQQ